MEFDKLYPQPPIPPLPPQPKPQWIAVTVKDHQGTIYGAFTVMVAPGQPIPGFHTAVQHLY